MKGWESERMRKMKMLQSKNGNPPRGPIKGKAGFRYQFKKKRAD